MYSPTLSLTDPPANSAIADGVMWIQGAALGTVATSAAVIAVGAIGLLMLSGRLELRRGITVVLGCFLLFGAAGIAGTLSSLNSASAPPHRPAAPNPDELALPPKPPSPPAAYDPYAGASVPTNREQ